MPAQEADVDTFDHGQESCTGVLLTNLGTPDAPTAEAVRRYLGEFLWDPRVVEINRLFWWPILNGIILQTRPARSARKYQKIWTDSGSPLLAIMHRQAKAVAQRLDEICTGPVNVAVGMRYGDPSISDALLSLQDVGLRRLLVFPLYPQYCTATTASTFDAVAEEFKGWRWIPELRMITHYHDHSGYIHALAESILDAWAAEDPAQRLLFSFHGIPKSSFLAGDPYHCECQKTARLVAERLALETGRWAVAFQSRFGYAEWIKPYTSEVLKEWAKAGIKSVDVVCPGFSADCLETLEEIAEENRDLFFEYGGERFRYIPALNDHPLHIEALVDLILTHSQGWPEMGTELDRVTAAAAREESLARALTMGAKR